MIEGWADLCHESSWDAKCRLRERTTLLSTSALEESAGLPEGPGADLTGEDLNDDLLEDDSEALAGPPLNLIKSLSSSSWTKHFLVE